MSVCLELNYFHCSFIRWVINRNIIKIGVNIYYVRWNSFGEYSIREIRNGNVEKSHLRLVWNKFRLLNQFGFHHVFYVSISLCELMILLTYISYNFMFGDPETVKYTKVQNTAIVRYSRVLCASLKCYVAFLIENMNKNALKILVEEMWIWFDFELAKKLQIQNSYSFYFTAEISHWFIFDLNEFASIAFGQPLVQKTPLSLSLNRPKVPSNFWSELPINLELILLCVHSAHPLPTHDCYLCVFHLFNVATFKFISYSHRN